MIGNLGREQHVNWYVARRLKTVLVAQGRMSPSAKRKYV